MQFILKPKEFIPSLDQEVPQKYILVLPLGSIFGKVDMFNFMVFHLFSFSVQDWSKTFGDPKKLTHKKFYDKIWNLYRRTELRNPNPNPLPLYSYANSLPNEDMVHVFVTYNYKVLIRNRFQEMSDAMDTTKDFESNVNIKKLTGGIFQNPGLGSPFGKEEKFVEIKYPLVDRLYYTFVNTYPLAIMRNMREAYNISRGGSPIKAQQTGLFHERFSQINKFLLHIKVPVDQMKIVSDFIVDEIASYVEIEYGCIYSIVHRRYINDKEWEEVKTKEIHWFVDTLCRPEGLNYGLKLDYEKIFLPKHRSYLGPSYGNSDISKLITGFFALSDSISVFDDEYLHKMSLAFKDDLKNFKKWLSSSGTSLKRRLFTAENWLKYLGFVVTQTPWQEINVLFGDAKVIDKKKASDILLKKVDDATSSSSSKKEGLFLDSLLFGEDEYVKNNVDYMIVYQLFLTPKMRHFDDKDLFPFIRRGDKTLEILSSENVISELLKPEIFNSLELDLDELKTEFDFYSSLLEFYGSMEDLVSSENDDVGGEDGFYENMLEFGNFIASFKESNKLRSRFVDEIKKFWTEKVFFGISSLKLFNQFLFRGWNKEGRGQNSMVQIWTNLKKILSDIPVDSVGGGCHVGTCELGDIEGESGKTLRSLYENNILKLKFHSQEMHRPLRIPTTFNQKVLTRKLDDSEIAIIETKRDDILKKYFRDDQISQNLIKNHFERLWLRKIENFQSLEIEEAESYFEEIQARLFSNENVYRIFLANPQIKAGFVNFLEFRVFNPTLGDNNWYQVSTIEENIENFLDDLHETKIFLGDINPARETIQKNDEIVDLTKPSYMVDYLNGECVQDLERLLALLSDTFSDKIGHINKEIAEFYRLLTIIYRLFVFDENDTKSSISLDEFSSRLFLMLKRLSRVRTRRLLGFKELSDLESDFIEKRGQIDLKTRRFYEKKDAEQNAYVKFIDTIESIISEMEEDNTKPPLDHILSILFHDDINEVTSDLYGIFVWRTWGIFKTNRLVGTKKLPYPLFITVNEVITAPLQIKRREALLKEFFGNHLIRKLDNNDSVKIGLGEFTKVFDMYYRMTI
jgi:hypothetical protein